MVNAIVRRVEKRNQIDWNTMQFVVVMIITKEATLGGSASSRGREEDGGSRKKCRSCRTRMQGSGGSGKIAGQERGVVNRIWGRHGSGKSMLALGEKRSCVVAGRRKSGGVIGDGCGEHDS